MKSKTPVRTVFQSALSADRLYRLRKVAEYRGVSMSTLFRSWIDAAYARLPKEAQ